MNRERKKNEGKKETIATKYLILQIIMTPLRHINSFLEVISLRLQNGAKLKRGVSFSMINIQDCTLLQLLSDRWKCYQDTTDYESLRIWLNIFMVLQSVGDLLRTKFPMKVFLSN
ncbi:transcription elongation factor GreA [Striga asiatica]|uniref:Transcription elongation factor GreA n=1 Tax=Striga asiatica TaxID=4170 RepID=A0A5A7RA92_STRAF|nr:transcription elongation factor GreA [Striga asiatica]